MSTSRAPARPERPGGQPCGLGAHVARSTASHEATFTQTYAVPTLTKMGEITSDLSTFRDLPDNVEMLVERG